EIRDLLRLADVADPCAAVRDVAAGHLGDVRAKIADLRKMERLLAKAVRQCELGEQAGCPVIDALSSGAGARRA
ncbi:MAG TPA: MerR family DNA-binding protein, partial [Stellaceae bacterium]